MSDEAMESDDVLAGCVECRGVGSVACFPDECGIGCCSEPCPECRGYGELLVDGATLRRLDGVAVLPLLPSRSQLRGRT